MDYQRRFFYGKGLYAQVSTFKSKTWVHIQGRKEKVISMTGDEFLSLSSHAEIKEELERRQEELVSAILTNYIIEIISIKVKFVLNINVRTK